MLDEVYRVIKYGNLDQLMESRDKCLNVIRKARDLYANRLYWRYYSTAAKHLPLYNREILKRRTGGEKTVSEELTKITGTIFIVLKSR
jgi:hypothetical protein